MEWIELKLKEYQLLRNEINNLVRIQYTIISLGITVIGGLSGYGLSVKDNLLLFSLVYLFGIPILAVIILFLWTGSVRRTLRTASYCREVEIEVSKVVNVPKKKISMPLFWENWINKMNKGQKTTATNNQEKIDYFITIALFMGFNIFSLAFGNIYINLYMVGQLVAPVQHEHLIIWSIFLFLIGFGFVYWRGWEIRSTYG